MIDLIRKYGYFTLAILCMVMAVVLENKFFSNRPGKQSIERFQKKLNDKESYLESRLDEISQISSDPGFCDNFLNGMSPYNNLMETEGIGFLIYRNDKLFYWSDRTIAFRDQLPLSVEIGRAHV